MCYFCYFCYPLLSIAKKPKNPFFTFSFSKNGHTVFYTMFFILIDKTLPYYALAVFFHKKTTCSIPGYFITLYHNNLSLSSLNFNTYIVWPFFDPFFESAKMSATFRYPWPKFSKKFQKKREKNGHTKKVTKKIDKNKKLK